MTTKKKALDELEAQEPAEGASDKQATADLAVPVVQSPLPPPPEPVARTGMVRCRIHAGNYHAERVYLTGEDVLVPAEEVEKLAHCLAPIT